MDVVKKAVMSCHIRRISDGDRVLYIQHFAESRDITVGEYMEYMEGKEDA